MILEKGTHDDSVPEHPDIKIVETAGTPETEDIASHRAGRSLREIKDPGQHLSLNLKDSYPHLSIIAEFLHLCC